MPNRTEVVLDKSYLQGATTAEVRDLCDQRAVFMIEALLYELLTTDDKAMRDCFAKLPSRDNPLELIPNVGALLRYEISNQTPCIPMRNRRVNHTFCFNPGMATGEFRFTGEQRATLREWQHETSEDVAGFIGQSAVVDGWFPGLVRFPPGGSRAALDAAMNQVATEPDFIRHIYDQIRKPEFPSAKVIDEEWAFFRRMQAHLCAGVQYVGKYGARNDATPSTRLEHDRLDLDYLILGCLAGGLATRDSNLANLFRILRPSGLLIQ